MKINLLLSIIKTTPPGGVPTWPEGATKALLELGVEIKFQYSLTGNGPHHFLHYLNVPTTVTATQIKEKIQPYGVEGEVYVFED
jgi:hypothetical protein|uniref:Uncharacterized protein n=1 Tax=candidate division WOR-3 bacterium TaxID=2052148 RepID=A0A7C3Z3D5_UNCW3